jgi:hypothetical protein
LDDGPRKVLDVTAKLEDVGPFLGAFLHMGGGFAFAVFLLGVFLIVDSQLDFFCHKLAPYLFEA